MMEDVDAALNVLVLWIICHHPIRITPALLDKSN